MARRSFTSLLIMAALFVVLFMLVWFTRPNPQAALRTLNQASLTAVPTLSLVFPFPQLPVSALAAVRLQRPDGSVSFTLQRDAAGNWSAPDANGVLMAAGAEAIARTISLLPYQNTVRREGALDLYGLDSPTMFVQIIRTDGGTHGIIIGGLSAGQNAYYALVDDRPEVYVMERGAVEFLIEALNNPPIDLTTLAPRATLSPDG
jgi:hypothetical protein